VYVSTCSLVLVCRYERVVTVRNFYTEDAYAIISGEINLLIKIATKENNEHMVVHIHLDKIYSSLFHLKIIMKGFIYSSLYSDCVHI
jgi:hypothetical protein